MNLQEKLTALEGRSFDFEKKRFDVTEVNYYIGKYYVYTAQGRTFVKDASQFENFLLAIKLRPVDEARIINPKPEKTMTNDLVAVNTSIGAAETMSSKLMEMFNTLSGTPTEADFKKSEAMTKVSNAVISVEQTKINYLKLKDRK